MIKCPKCEARVIPKADGSCPSCQFQLAEAQSTAIPPQTPSPTAPPAPVAPQVAAAPTNTGAAAPDRAAAPLAPPPPAPSPAAQQPLPSAAPGTCDVCCQSRPVVERSAFTLFRKRLGLNFAPERSLLVGCQCCPECFQQRMRTQRWPLLNLAILPVATVACFGTIFLAESLKQAGTLKSAGWLVAIGFVLFVVPWVLFPLLASRMIRRSSSTLFDPAVRAKLHRNAGVPHWGMLCRPEFLRKFPPGGVDVELRQLRTVPDSEIQPWNLKRPFPWVRLGVAAAVVAVAGFVIFNELTYQTPSELVAADYESRVAELQQKLNAALAKLPAPGSVDEVTPADPVEPKPDASNTLFVSVDAVQGKGQPAMPVSDNEPWEPEPETDPRQRFPDVRLSEDETDKIFRWRPDVANEYFRRPPERLKTLYEQMVTARYLNSST